MLVQVQVLSPALSFPVKERLSCDVNLSRGSAWSDCIALVLTGSTCYQIGSCRRSARASTCAFATFRDDPFDLSLEIRQDLLRRFLIPAPGRGRDDRLVLIPVASEVSRALLPDDLTSVVRGNDRRGHPFRLAAPPSIVRSATVDLDEFLARRYRTRRRFLEHMSHRKDSLPDAYRPFFVAGDGARWLRRDASACCQQLHALFLTESARTRLIARYYGCCVQHQP